MQNAALGSDPISVARTGRRTVSLLLRLPIVWLALALFAALLGACVLTVVLALGQSDGALPDVGERVLSMPALRPENRE